MRATIVIPVHNRASLTRQCLEMLLVDPGVRDRAAIVVVDDGSTDHTPELLAGFGDAVRVVTHDRPTGFATACNAGAAAAEGDYVVFLNNDTLPVQGWLDALVAYADARPRAAVVGAKLLFPDDTIQHAGMTITEDGNPRHIYAGFPADHPAVNRSRRFQVVTAACALYRRSVFDEAGGFDDAFRNGFEDVDLCLRLGDAGYEIHYCHEGVVYHLEMGTRDFAHELDNQALYRRRWADRVRPDAMSRYVEDGLLEPRYDVRYPFSLRVSPQLATVAADEAEKDRLLATQAAETATLLRENVELRIRLAEAGIEPSPPTLETLRAERPDRPQAALFLSDLYGDAVRYRCDQRVEQLGLLGVTSRSQWRHHTSLGQAVDAYGSFVLHRVRDDDDVRAFVDEVHRHGKVVVFDADEFASDGSERTMAAADAVFVATEPAARSARSLNDRVSVVPNVAGSDLVHLADEALERRERHSGAAVRLAFVGGSDREDRGLGEATEAVLRALNENSSVRLVLVGEPSLDRRFERYADRIERKGIVPWRRLPAILASVDINLVPFELGDPVEESRSCVNWLEAALVASPTVASPVPDYVRVIEPGVTGMLAETAEDWRVALGELVESADRRLAIGEAARQEARSRHTTEEQAQTFYASIAELARGASRERKLTVNWLVGPGAVVDPKQLARVAGELGWRGHQVRLFADSVPRQVRSSVDPQPISGPFPPADVAIASDATTAAAIGEQGRALFNVVLMDEPFRHASGFRLPPLLRPEESKTDVGVIEAALLRWCFARADASWYPEDSS